MSLINDALKRAKQSHERQTRVAVTDPPLQPVPDIPSSGSSLPWPLIGAGLLTLLLAGWSLSVWWRSSNRVIPARAIAASVAAPQIARTTNPLPVKTSGPMTNLVRSVVQNPAAKPAATLPALSAPAPSHRPATNVAMASGPTSIPVSNASAGQHLTAAAATPPPRTSSNQGMESKPAMVPTSSEGSVAEPALGDLKVQGIFYRLSRSSTLINGQTLFVGDEIAGGKIVAINRYSVDVRCAGRTNILKLR